MSPYRELPTISKPIKQKSTWKKHLKCFLYGHDFLSRTPNVETVRNGKTKNNTYYLFFLLESEVLCTRCEKHFKHARQEIDKNVSLSDFMEIHNLLIDNFDNLKL